MLLRCSALLFHPLLLVLLLPYPQIRITFVFSSPPPSRSFTIPSSPSMEQQSGLPPGFRFSPTDEELVVYYLKNKVNGKPSHDGIIAELDIYKFEPWELRAVSALQTPDPVWYFFNAQDQKHSRTVRINRTTNQGYWKATGKDRKIISGSHTVGIKKTLIYYQGRAPNGVRTDWIMHEYKLSEDLKKKSTDGFVPTLCRIRKKSGPGPRNGEQYGAPVLCDNDDEEDDDENSEQYLNFTTETTYNAEEKPQIIGEVFHDFPTSVDGLNNDINTESSLQHIPVFLSEDDQTSHMNSVGGILADPFIHDSDLEGLFAGKDEENPFAERWITSDELNGDYIELYDMKDPLDGFQPLSLLQDVSLFDHQLYSNTVAEDVQGRAPHRIRLQVSGLSGQSDITELPGCSLNVIPKLEPGEGVVENIPGAYSQNSVHPTSVITRNSNNVAPIGGSSTTRSFIAKHESSFTVSVRKETPPPVFCSLIENSVGGSSKTEEATVPDEESCSDCEARIFTLQLTESENKQPKSSFKSRLKSKLGSLATRMRQFENHVSMKLNERLSRLGKRAQVFFVEDYMNPVNLMRRGLVSLLYLLTAVLVSMLLYLGVRIFT